MGEERVSRTIVCAAHGLRYDPSVATGCVICKRASSSNLAAVPASASLPVASVPVGAKAESGAKVPDAGPTTPDLGEVFVPPGERAMEAAGRARDFLATGQGKAVAALLVLALGGGLFFALRSKPEAAGAATSDVSGLDATQGAIVRYLDATDRVEASLPYEEARAATEGIGAQARNGTLDPEARREKFRSYLAKLDALKVEYEALPCPEAAKTYRSIMLEWFVLAGKQVELSLDQLRQHDEVRRLAERKRSITTREEARELADDVRRAEDAVKGQLERGRGIVTDLRATLAKKNAEEARLVKEYRLPDRSGEGAEKGRLLTRREREKALGDAWCQSILESGGTEEDCEAAKRP